MYNININEQNQQGVGREATGSRVRQND